MSVATSSSVSTRSRPKAAGVIGRPGVCGVLFQHAAARRRLENERQRTVGDFVVSTRSRPKAAGLQFPTLNLGLLSFNTQPPEGGWDPTYSQSAIDKLFQHAAARRRLAHAPITQHKTTCFNTQPPEGGWRKNQPLKNTPASFNTQPPEGGWLKFLFSENKFKRFNTQPPEGGWPFYLETKNANHCFNTQPPEGGWFLPVSTH